MNRRLSSPPDSPAYSTSSVGNEIHHLNLLVPLPFPPPPRRDARHQRRRPSLPEASEPDSPRGSRTSFKGTAASSAPSDWIRRGCSSTRGTSQKVERGIDRSSLSIRRRVNRSRSAPAGDPVSAGVDALGQHSSGVDSCAGSRGTGDGGRMGRRVPPGKGSVGSVVTLDSEDGSSPPGSRR